MNRTALDPSCCYLEQRKGYNNRPTTYLREDLIQGKTTRPDGYRTTPITLDATVTQVRHRLASTAIVID